MKKPSRNASSPRWLAAFLGALIVAVFTHGAMRVEHRSGGSSGLHAAPMASIAAQSARFAFSEDGRVMAGIDTAGRLVLWDVLSGVVQRVVPGHFGDTVQDLVLSPNAATLASLGQGSVQLWDTGEGLARSTLPLPASNASGRLLFSPDGSKLAVVSQSGTVALWDTRDGSVRQIQTGPLGSIGAVVFSPDGAELASGGKNGQIRIWNTVTGRLEAAHGAQPGVPIADLIAAPDGETLAVRDENAVITVWNPRTGVSHQFLPSKQTVDAGQMAFSPDGASLASVDAGGQIAIRDVASGQIRLTLPADAGIGVGDLVFSRQGGYLASIGSDAAVRLWDSVRGQLLRVLTGQRDAITRVAFSFDANYLTSVAKNGDVMVWDLTSGSAIHAFNVSGSDSAGLVASSGSAVGNISNVSSAGAEVSASLPSVAAEQGGVTAQAGTTPQAAKPKLTGSKREKRSPHDWKGIVALSISPDGQSIGVAEQDGTVRIVDARFSPRIGGKAHHGAPASAVVFSATGRNLISAGRDSAVYSWDSVNGQKSLNLLGLEHASRAVAASPDGKFIAGAGEETRVMVWDAASGKLSKIFLGSTDFVNALAFSPDGQSLAAGGADARIRVWDVPTGTLLKTLLGHTDEVNSLMFSPDGRRLASGGKDSSVRVWDVTAWRQIYNLQGHQAAVRTVVFSRDGKALFSAGEDSRILAWNATTGQLSRQITGLSGIVNALGMTLDGNLVVGGDDRSISEWDPRNGKRLLNGLLPLTTPATTSALDKLSSAAGPADSGVAASTFQRGFLAGRGESSSASAAGAIEQILNWLIPAAEAAIPAPPGGPILVVTSASSPYSNYYGEILRTEGLNEYALADLGSVTAAALAAYDLVILPPMSLSAAQVSMFSTWVSGGGNLIAMHPDPQLAGLLGLTATGTSLSNAYLLVDTSAAPGNGIAAQTLQFHGSADRYTLNGATSLATLYSDATTATSNPAVTLRVTGSGKAAAFAYDLATSIVYTRQGNPAWAAQERDGFTPIRSDDKFFGNMAGDVQPDWVDLNTEVGIPQADEQLRLLTNLIVNMNLAKKPLPRFWYFPGGKKAVVVMTGDDHANGGTAGRFDQYLAASPAGCSVSNWECVRGTSYIYPNSPLTKTQFDSYTAQGFEVGLHLNTNCADYTPATLEDFYTQQIQQWTATYLGATSSLMPSGSTQRHHCIAWSDWVTGAKTQLAHGMRLDVSYYFWPPSWVGDRPGHFTGSALPMRFADLDGTLIDVYNVPTEMTDESGQSYPFTSDTLLSKAVGPEGYYGVYTVNAHTDTVSNPVSDAVVSSAQSRGVPIISSTQLLTWLDARGNSSLGSFAFANNTLTFSIAVDSAANGLQALVPLRLANGNAISGITRGGAAVTYTSETIKGLDYARFLGVTGAYSVTYATTDTTPPTVTATSPTAGVSQVSAGTTVTATFSEAMTPTSISSSTFELRDGGGALVPASITYDAASRTATLKPSSSLSFTATYTAKVKGGAGGVTDLAGNPMAADFPWSFTTEAQPCASTACSAWSDSTVPGVPDSGDASATELGVKFRTNVDGYITGVRFYKASLNTGSHVGNLWKTDGTKIASANFINESGSGWQTVTFSTPVAVTANTVYIASYYAPNGHYAYANGGFATAGVDNGAVHLLANTESANGVYKYGAASAFPTDTFQASNYWVDVVFTTTPPSGDVTPPTVSMTAPANGATVSGAAVTVSATASDNVGVSNVQFLLDGAALGSPVTTAPYTLTWDSTTVGDGSHTLGARASDAAGNAATASVAVNASNGSTGSCGSRTTIWPTTATPTQAAITDGQSIEVGVKFRSNTAGYICGIRFYKGAANTGTHTGSLWSSTGQQLAQAQFANETASGWQEVSFGSPVAIAANTVYVASYHSPAYFADSGNYFTSGVDNGPLHALSNAESANGVYQYGSASVFPTATYQADNYWVDVVFSSTAGPDTTPPTVQTTTPASGATAVGVHSSVTATFSEALDATTVTPSNFTLTGPGGAAVASTVSYDPGTFTATLTPTSALALNTAYTATVTTGVKDLAGNALATAKTWNFTTVASDPCLTGNPIVQENCKTGNPASEWDISGIGDSAIQGFATDISVNRGSTIDFKINTTAPYRIDIYRLGYYAGNGARKVATIPSTNTLSQNQPACLTDTTTKLADCGNWAVSASWAVPSTATSGIYIARPVRTDTGGASHIAFIVRDDDRDNNGTSSALLFQASDTSWQAYNYYGGNSLYGDGSNFNLTTRAYKVSYNRPFVTRTMESGISWLFNAEYPMIRWLEANGYDVSYFTGVDSDRFGNKILNHKVFLSVGHDEYWSGQQRLNVEAARDTGVHLAFFSGNSVFHKTRWENSIDGTNTPYRTLVDYKESAAEAKIDPSPQWTGVWRDPTGALYDAGRPENSLLGNLFIANGPRVPPDALSVSAEDGKMRLWRNTPVASLSAGQTATFAAGTLGYEWEADNDDYISSRPAGAFRNSSTTVNISDGNCLLNTAPYGHTYGNCTATHALMLYRQQTSRALVFGAGTIQWSWGLDANHDAAFYAAPAADVRMQQATVNLLADMGVQPSSLQTGLVAASASTDGTAPTATVVSPTNGATVGVGSSVTISGTAADTGGGVVGGVEVSVNGGTQWLRANGRAAWTYAWTPTSSGTVVIRARAVDDSGNLGAASSGISVTVGTGADTTPPTVSMTAPANGATVSGAAVTVSASASDNVGVASVQFLLDGAALGSPVTTAPYSMTWDSTTASNGAHTLSARASDAAGNVTTATGVTVTLSNGGGGDTTPPTVSMTAPANGATVSGGAVTVSANASDNVGVSSVQFLLDGVALGSPVTTAPYSITWDSTAASNGAHTVSARASDAAGNVTTATGVTVTVSNGGAGASCGASSTIWASTATPAQAAITDGQSIEVGVKFRSNTAGYICGIRFYKGAANTGTHTGTLWSSTGQQLAQAQFANETASGWQEVSFGSPVAIAANTVYVASYHSPAYFADSGNYFTSGVDNGPLHALSNAESANGVYQYGSASVFPTATYQADNYWVDVVFSSTLTSGSDTTAPTVSMTAPANGTTVNGSAVTVSANASDNVGVSGVQFLLDGVALGSPVTTAPYSMTWDSTTASNGAHTLSARASDAAGNAATSAAVSITVSNTTAAAPTAVDDLFLFRANTARTVNYTGPLGAGVLANDTDPGNLPLSAAAVGTLPTGVTLASSGVLTINRGTATSIHYRANNGNQLSQPATGALVTLVVDTAPTAVAETCTYTRAGSGSVTGAACSMTGTRAFRMNLISNDTDSNSTTNVPTDGVGRSVVGAVITATSSGVAVSANNTCSPAQPAISRLLPRATIVNNCDGTITVTVASTATTSPITLTYGAVDDLGLQSASAGRATDTVTVL